MRMSSRYSVCMLLRLLLSAHSRKQIDSQISASLHLDVGLYNEVDLAGRAQRGATIASASWPFVQSNSRVLFLPPCNLQAHRMRCPAVPICRSPLRAGVAHPTRSLVTACPTLRQSATLLLEACHHTGWH